MKDFSSLPRINIRGRFGPDKHILQIMERSDGKLVNDYLNGDKTALDILIQKHLKSVYGFVFGLVGDRHEAEDITQESFLKAWRNLKKFDRDKSFRTWVIAIAKNASIDYLRKKKSLPFSSFEDEWGYNSLFDSLADASSSPEELAGRADLSGRLGLVVEGLSPRYRSVISLRYNDNLTFREIAERLGESVNTVKTRHRRALSIMGRLFPR